MSGVPARGGPTNSFLGSFMPSRIRSLAATTGLALLLTAAAAGATCIAPTAPGTYPDGQSASLDEMKAGLKMVKEYQAQADAYMDCLSQEEPKADPKKQYSDKEKETMKAAVTAAEAKITATQGEKEAVAARINEQVKAFKAKASAAAPAGN